MLGSSYQMFSGQNQPLLYIPHPKVFNVTTLKSTSIVLCHPDAPLKTEGFILPAAGCRHHCLGQGHAPFPGPPTAND